MSDTRTEPRTISRRKRWLFNLVILAVCTLVFVVLAEGSVRLFFPQPLTGVQFAYHPEFGFFNQPGLRNARFQSEPGCPFYRVTTDATGFRASRPVSAKPAGAKRVVVLGDSYVFGVGVTDDATLPARLEQVLNASGGAARYEVVNAGCPGWSTENELAFWRARGAGLDADLLVLAFFRNDLCDNLRHWLFDIEGGRPVFAPKGEVSRLKRLTEKIPFYSFLCRHSHLVNLLRRAAIGLVARPAGKRAADAAAEAGRAPDPPAPGESDPAKPSEAAGPGAPYEVPPWLEDQIAVYVPLMDALIDDTREQGVPLLLVLLPSEDDCVERPSAHFLESERLAREWDAAGRLRALSLRPALLRARRGGADLFLPVDAHYTAEGNRLAAEEIAPAVLGMLDGKQPGV